MTPADGYTLEDFNEEEQRDIRSIAFQLGRTEQQIIDNYSLKPELDK